MDNDLRRSAASTMKSRTRQAARAGVTGAAAFGVALLVLQGAQQAVGAFNPRDDVSIAFLIAVAAGTLTLDRLRVRHNDATELQEQREALEEGLHSWEPEPFEKTDPNDLGIFPPRTVGAEDWKRYVVREVHTRLCEALAIAPFVLVFGGPRSGKTRTAAQATREVMPEAPVLIPRHADGLRVFLDQEPPIKGERAVLWLDGLERFSGVLDAKILDWLGATHQSKDDDEGSAYPGPPITIVATIREATWDRLLEADGEEGEFARAVAARARAFGVPTKLDGAEQGEVHELFGEADLAGGLGAALAASGKDEQAPTMWPAKHAKELPGADQPAAWRSRMQVPEDKWLLLPAGACLLAVLWVAGSAAVNGGISKPRQLTIGEQAALIRSNGSEGPRTGEKPNTVDFHGTGQESYVFSFRDQSRTHKRSPQADEIQVWDVVGGDTLKERFHFQPADPAVFQFRGVADVDGDGEEELIGGYGPITHSGELLVPFAIDWNSDTGNYRIVNLHPSPPSLDIKDTPRIRRASAPYRTLTNYTDGNGNSVSGYPSQDFAVIPDAQRLISGYFISSPTATQPASLDVEVELFDTQASRPRLRDCNFPNDKPVLAQEQSGALLFNVLDERWTTVSANKRCAPEL